VLTWLGIVEIWHVYLMSFLLGAIKAVDMPARHSFVIDMVEGKQDLTNAIGLNSAIFNGARTLGPALAGVAVATMGEAIAFFLNALSFLAVIASLVSMRNLPISSFKREGSTSTKTHMVQGLRFVFGQQTLLVLMSLVAVSSFLSMPYSTLMPVFADTLLKDSAQPLVAFLCSGNYFVLQCQAPEALPLGLLLTCVGIGAVMGALIVASLPERAPRGRMLTLGNLFFPSLLLIFVNSRFMLLSLVVMTLVGISFVMQNAMMNTLLQLTAPDELRGRVMSLYSLISQGMTHLGGLQAGFVADWIGAPVSVGLGAAISLAYGLYVAVRYRSIRIS
jgi:MFS family permease